MADKSNDNFFDSEVVTLRKVRMDFADIWEPAPPMEEGKKGDRKNWRYKIKVILGDRENEAYQEAKKAFNSAAKGMWGANAKNVLESMGQQQRGLRDGNKYLDNSGGIREEYKDQFFISASNANQPLVLGPKRVNQQGRLAKESEGGYLPEISADGVAYVKGQEIDNMPYEVVAPYRGCYVNIRLWFVAMKGTPKTAERAATPNQIFCRFDTVQYNSKGEAFGNARATQEGFGEGDGDEDLEEGSVGSNAADDDLEFED